ncbi:MAG: sulfurtransferase [Gammaproteobacteria bacterium]|nr:sulfurtransferase [Gammaproteobacteria bacterium]
MSQTATRPITLLIALLFSGLLLALTQTVQAANSHDSASANTPEAISDDGVFISPEKANLDRENTLFIDLSDQSSYRKFHIPDALWMNYDWLIKPQNGLALSGGVDYMSHVLAQVGINPDTHLVIYDDLGNLNASRLYWELKKLKHNDVRILDGGTIAWILKGYKVTQTLPKRPDKAHYPTPKSHLTDALTADKADIKAALKDGRTLLIDTRSEAEYIGSAKVKRSGHIPGAQHFEWSLSVDSRNGYQQQAKPRLLAHLKTLGITDKTQPIIAYCNSAHRASRVVSMLDSLGFTNVKLYDGSMQEYGIDSSLPLTLGAKP